MFLHIGGDYVVPHNEIVAIIDYNLRAHSKITRKYLEQCKDQGICTDVSDGMPKSIVITKDKVILSQISTQTLKKRGDSRMSDLDNFLR